MARMSSYALSLVVYMHTFITCFGTGHPLERFLQRENPGSSLIIRPPADVKQTLLVCNAFAHTSNLQMTFVPKGTDLGILPYKKCRDFRMPLAAGNQIDFTTGNINVGTFSVSQIPQSAGALLIVVQRRASDSMGATFKSHAFAKDTADIAQVVTIDTYMGVNKTGNEVYITHSSIGQKDPKIAKPPEMLPMNSVVAISPGEYQVALGKQGGTLITNKMMPLSAEGQSSYVVLRVGASEEDLVVFPSAAHRIVRASSSFLLVIAAAMHLVFGI